MSFFRLAWPVWNWSSLVIYGAMAAMMAVVIGINCYMYRRRGGMPNRPWKRSKKAADKAAAAAASAGGSSTNSSGPSTGASSPPVSTGGSSSFLRVEKATSAVVGGGGGGRRILVAGRSASVGTCLASESALLVVPSLPRSALQMAFDGLTAEAQDQVWTFPDGFASGLAAAAAVDGSPSKTLYGILRTNVLPIGAPLRTDEPAVRAASVDETGTTTTPLCRAQRGGLFPLLSRAQHSCRPNADVFFCDERQRAFAFPLRRISEGEEVTRSCLAGVEAMDYEQRHQALATEFGVAQCACALCASQRAPGANGSSRSDARTTSDANRRRIGTLSALLPQLHSDPARALQTAERLIDLLAGEGFESSWSATQVLDQTARLIAATPKYETRAVEYARRAWEHAVHHRGADSTFAAQAKLRLVQAQQDLQMAGVREKEA